MLVINKYTPGPWEAKFGVGAGWSVSKANERPGYTGHAPICSMAWFQFPIEGIITEEISEANARLIAAAPELLKSLKEILSMIDSSPTMRSIIMAKEAIAKAEGLL